MIKRVMLSFLVVGGMLPVAASAQDSVSNFNTNVQQIGYSEVNYSNLHERIESMEAEIASLRSGSGGCDSCDGGGCGSCYSDSGWNFGVDVVYAKPYFSDGLDTGDSNYDFSVTPRFILAYKNEYGFGVRSRYWWFDRESSVADGTGNLNTGDQFKLSMQVFDLELTKDLDWGCVDAMLFAGIRYANIDHRQIAGSDDITRASGWGPTIGIDTLTALSDTYSLVANFRYSVLFGNGTADHVSSPDNLVDLGFNSLELQLGVQWQRCYDAGTLQLRGLVEAQNWQSVSQETDDVGNHPDDDLLMLGFVLGASFLY